MPLTITTAWLCLTSKNKSLRVTVAYHTYRKPKRLNFCGHATNRDKRQPVKIGNLPYSQKPKSSDINQPGGARMLEYPDTPTPYHPKEQPEQQRWMSEHLHADAQGDQALHSQLVELPGDGYCRSL